MGAPIDRSNLDFLRDYKAEIFSRWKVEAKPGLRIPYYEGVLNHPTQRAMHFGEDTLVPGRRLIVPAAQRSGKSIFLAAEYVAQVGIPGTQIWHCAPTYDLCGKSWAYVWDAIIVQRVLGDHIDRAVDSKDEREIKLRWGEDVSWIRTRSTDPGKGYQQLVGDQLDGIGWDECGDQPEGVATRYLLPRLVNRKGWFCAISEPKEFNWFWEFYRRREETQFYLDGWRGVSFSMAENPFVDAEEIAKLERTLSPAESARVIYGQFSSLAGQVWPMYRDELFPHGHLYDPGLRDSGLPHGFNPRQASRFRIIDIGVDHPASCLWLAVDRENDDRYYYHDYEEKRDTHRDHALQIAAETTLPITASFIGQDAQRTSGLKREIRTLCPLDIYRQAGIYCRVVNDGPGSNSAGISAIGQMLANTFEDHPEGPRLFISKECVKLREAILRHTYKRSGVETDQATEVPSKYRDDLAEALRRSGKVHLRYAPPISRSEVDGVHRAREAATRRGIRGRATVPRI